MSSESRPTIIPTIALACFQGSAHIVEQLESIRSQTHSKWRLLVRDDGSTDGTVELVKAKAEEDPRIELIQDDSGRLGVVGNFSRILEVAKQRGARWIALSDQDDRWRPDKLERQLARASSWEAQPSRPRLLHSDLSVVGPDLSPRHPSLHRFMGLRHKSDSALSTLLVQNFVTGCSCLVNRSLLDIALPIPSECVMADWWLALCAASTGQLEFEPDPLVLYRQHDANAIGAQSLQLALRGLLRKTLSPRRHDPAEFVDTLRQVEALERRLSSVRDRASSIDAMQISASIELVSGYLDLFRDGSSRLRRISYLRKMNIRRQNPILDLMLEVRLLTGTIDWPDRRAATTDGAPS